MAQVMAPSGGAPTGNPLSDANLVSIGTAGVQVDPTAAAAAINNTNAQQAALASDCLWPPSGQVTLPIIPGLWHQTVSIPCLVSYSEARAVIGAGILLLGVGVIGFGLNIYALAAALPLAGRIGTLAGGAAVGGAVGAAEGEAASTSHVVEHPQAPAIADANRRSDARRPYTLAS